VKVGDFCRVGEHMGTVEDVGLRATRLRTLDRTLLSIPNSEFASARIENYTARDKIRFAHILSLGYDTSPDQMRFVLTRMREILIAHPKVDPKPCRARFIRYGAHSLDIELFAFVLTTDFDEYLAIQEDLFLHIYDAVQESGATFAFPSQTLYLGRDPGRDAERTQAAEERVRAWREAGQLPFPHVAPARIAELDDSLPWPPEGAPRTTEPGTGGPDPSNTGERGGRKGWWR
jgi:MscS family membrane protein